MRSVEKSARTVEEAIEEALKELSARRDQVQVEVLDEGSKGFLGLLGGRPARVRVTLLQSLEKKIEAAEDFLRQLLQHMGIEATVSSSRGEGDLVTLSISGRRIGSVIGRRGQTLDAVQYLVNLVANKVEGPRVRFIVDAEGYREKRAETLRNLALRIADRVHRERRKVSLEPMSALERRIVHLALVNDERVETHSEGEEPYRRVVIVPKRA